MDDSEWWGVWCWRDGEDGFWRQVQQKPIEPLQTTRTEAERLATALTEGARTRTDSIGWRYEARRYDDAK